LTGPVKGEWEVEVKWLPTVRVRDLRLRIHVGQLTLECDKWEHGALPPPPPFEFSVTGSEGVVCRLSVDMGLPSVLQLLRGLFLARVDSGWRHLSGRDASGDRE